MRWIIGVDEVGRGPIAGPIAVGAVCIPIGDNVWEAWEGLKDSKKLTEKRRERWFAEMKERKVRYTVSMIDAQYIDEYGIAQAAREAVASTIGALNVTPDKGHVLLDAGLTAPEEFHQEAIVKGDEHIPAIALASVAAKVTRDRYLCEMGEKHPGYGFERHKGYGTAAHYEAIREQGLLEGIHRRTFIHLD